MKMKRLGDIVTFFTRSSKLLIGSTNRHYVKTKLHVENSKVNSGHFVHVFTPGGHSITKHTGGGGWLEGLSQKPQNIYPKIAILKKMLKSYPLNILKVQS